jgi:hypothetical protein
VAKDCAPEFNPISDSSSLNRRNIGACVFFGLAECRLLNAECFNQKAAFTGRLCR